MTGNERARPDRALANHCVRPAEDTDEPERDRDLWTGQSGGDHDHDADRQHEPERDVPSGNRPPEEAGLPERRLVPPPG